MGREWKGMMYKHSCWWSRWEAYSEFIVRVMNSICYSLSTSITLAGLFTSSRILLICRETSTTTVVNLYPSCLCLPTSPPPGICSVLVSPLLKNSKLNRMNCICRLDDGLPGKWLYESNRQILLIWWPCSKDKEFHWNPNDKYLRSAGRKLWAWQQKRNEEEKIKTL